MSANKFSDTVTKAILDRLGAQLNDNLIHLSSLSLSSQTSPESLVLSTEGRRAITDVNQEGIISQKGINILAERFSDASSNLNLLVTATKKDLKGAKTVENIVDQYYYITAEKSNIVKYVKTEIYNKIPNSDINSIDVIKQAFNTVSIDLAKQASDKLSTPSMASNFIEYLRKLNPESFKEISTNATTNTTDKSVFLGNSHRELNKHFKNYLISIGTPMYLVEFIDLNIDAGHVLGMFTQQILYTTGAKILNTGTRNIAGTNISLPQVAVHLPTNNTLQQQDQKFVDNIFTGTVQLLADADLVSSSLLQDVDLFTEAFKRSVTPDSMIGILASVELQLGKDNRAAGSILTTISKNLKSLQQRGQRYIDYASESNRSRSEQAIASEVRQAKVELAALITSTKKLAEYIEKISKEITTKKNTIYTEQHKIILKYLSDNAKAISNSLIETAGSDPIKIGIKKSIISLIDDTKKYNPSKTPTKVKVDKKVGKKTSNKLVVPKIKNKNIKPVKKSIVLGAGSINTKGLKISNTSLLNLPNLINSMLAEQIRQNMGTGGRRDVLNYRSGRFATSAKVERISESRQGMITAFYTYMKYPYATFSEGGRQEFPRSRDPKLLISKSIREIGQTLVSNRMRAVLV